MLRVAENGTSHKFAKIANAMICCAAASTRENIFFALHLLANVTTIRGDVSVHDSLWLIINYFPVVVALPGASIFLETSTPADAQQKALRING